jgi:hypothetical protein
MLKGLNLQQVLQPNSRPTPVFHQPGQQPDSYAANTNQDANRNFPDPIPDKNKFLPTELCSDPQDAKIPNQMKKKKAPERIRPQITFTGPATQITTNN